MQSLTDGTSPMISVESNGSNGECGRDASKKIRVRNEDEDLDHKVDASGTTRCAWYTYDVRQL